MFFLFKVCTDNYFARCAMCNCLKIKYYFFKMKLTAISVFAFALFAFAIFLGVSIIVLSRFHFLATHYISAKPQKKCECLPQE